MLIFNIMKNSLKNFNSGKFALVLILITIFLVQCNWPLVEYYKVSYFQLEQNYSIDDSINNVLEYDSLFFKCNLFVDYNNDYVTNGECPCYEITYYILDYYKSIEAITIYDYNEDYLAGDTISDILTFYYFDEINPHYNYNKKIITFEAYGEPMIYKNINHFLYVQAPHYAYPFQLQLNVPPDSIQIFQFKLNIELMDGRKFTLYSLPIKIQP